MACNSHQEAVKWCSLVLAAELIEASKGYRVERIETMVETIKVGDDPLKEVPNKDLPDMLFRMESNFPFALHAHEYIKTLLKWKQKDPKLNMAILAPNGDYKLGILFFTLRNGELNGSIYCHDDMEIGTMQKALATTKKVPLNGQKIYMFTCMTSKSYEAIKPTVAGWQRYIDRVLWLPWYCAREIEVHLPEGVEIRKLSPEHADQINEIWPHKYDGSRELIAEMLKINFGLGVFRKHSLLSWAIHWFYGGIGSVQTVDNEKRKGYGRAVVEAMTKKLGEMQINVHVNVVLGNKVGETLFKSIGYRYAFDSYWVDLVESESN